jgi:hypothetical protein
MQLQSNTMRYRHAKQVDGRIADFSPGGVEVVIERYS